MTEYQLTRVEQPRLDLFDHGPLDSLVGGQWEWCWANSLPYRALAAPVIAQMPAAPRPDAEIMPYLSYWNSLQGFLTFSFGWTRHDRGLRWWYDAGRPLGDPRLALLDAVWERDGNLIAYIEWCHDRLSTLSHQALAEWTTFDSSRDELSPHWEKTLRAVRERPEVSAATPHGKHLESGGHSDGPAAGQHDAKLVVVPDSEHRAVLTAGSALGWYRGLVELGESLPKLSNASWRVDVYVRPIGFLGTYRRSRATGLWFSGRHRFHTVGH
ncbi:hypothetical protein [Agromyces laixinhei]|uniref:hypothetical protein n=1 Tax=Agromyces laixinhei TaxID=2585717 RepID=UPI0012EEA3F4|nr:hypothetical protein [Agromyces laixinhei]